MSRKNRALFTRKCGNHEPHTPHIYVKRWKLVELPLLPEPDRYPSEWDVRYRCPGFKLPGKTWAESLGLEIPENAPGGQRIIARHYRLRGTGQNNTQIDYEGIYDTDAHRSADH